MGACSVAELSQLLGLGATRDASLLVKILKLWYPDNLNWSRLQ